MIQVNNLFFAYRSHNKKAVDGISFTVSKGEVFGFLGPNGAGKSTTQKILIGLLAGYQGEINILGKDLRHWGKQYYEKIGVSFELPNHYQKLTALENLSFFRSLYSGDTEEPMALLEAVNLQDEAGKLAGSFSKGMLIRLNIARALINKPQLLFLDEPTSGLDPVNARRIRELILRLKGEGRTVFLTTHDMHTADELCDRVAFIVDGRIALIDSPRKLKYEMGERVVTVGYGMGETTTYRDFPLTGLGQNREFLALIAREDLRSIHTKESSLEDIFIRVTGRNL